MRHHGPGMQTWVTVSQLGWRGILAVGSQGIVSVSAWVEECSGSWESGNCTGHYKHSSLQPCPQEGFPNVTALLCQERASLSKVDTTPLWHSRVQQLCCQGKATPVKVLQVTILLCLASDFLSEVVTTGLLREGKASSAQDLLGRKNPCLYRGRTVANWTGIGFLRGRIFLGRQGVG